MLSTTTDAWQVINHPVPATRLELNNQARHNLRRMLELIRDESSLTDDGFTKIEAIYDAESQKCVSSQILATNGVTNGQAAEAVGYAAGMLLREAMSDSN